MEKKFESLTRDAITWVWGKHCNELERFTVSKEDLRLFTEYVVLTLIDNGYRKVDNTTQGYVSIANDAFKDSEIPVRADEPKFKRD